VEEEEREKKVTSRVMGMRMRKDLQPTCACLANCRRNKEIELAGITMTIVLGKDNLESC